MCRDDHYGGTPSLVWTPGCLGVHGKLSSIPVAILPGELGELGPSEVLDVHPEEVAET